MAPPGCATSTRGSEDEAERIRDLVGATPLTELPRYSGPGGSVWVKSEETNPTGTVRDRYVGAWFDDRGRLGGAGELAEIASLGLDDWSVSVAFWCTRFDLDCRIFARSGTSRRVAPLAERYGAEIRWVDADGRDWRALEECAEDWSRTSRSRAICDVDTAGPRRRAARELSAELVDDLRRIGARTVVLPASTDGSFAEVGSALTSSVLDVEVVYAIGGDPETIFERRPGEDRIESRSLEQAWEARNRIAESDGLLLGPRGATASAAARSLIERGRSESPVVVLNPDAGQRYLGWEEELERTVDTERRVAARAVSRANLSTRREYPMSIAVRIPTPLRKHTDGEEEVEIEGSTAGDVLQNLADRHPGLRDKLFDEDGELRRFVNVFANDEDIRHADLLETPVEDGDEVSIVPAMAGG